MENHWLQILKGGLASPNRSRDWQAYEAGRARLLEVLSEAPGTTDRELEACLVDLARSGDGYIREAAVRQLGKQGRSQVAFRVLIERQNDWVSQVRLAALASQSRCF